MAFKKSRVRSGSFCTGVGSSRHYIQMLQAGPEETRPNEIALTGVARDAPQLYPGNPGHFYHMSNVNPHRNTLAGCVPNHEWAERLPFCEASE